MILKGCGTLSMGIVPIWIWFIDSENLKIKIQYAAKNPEVKIGHGQEKNVKKGAEDCKNKKGARSWDPLRKSHDSPSIFSSG